MANNQSDLSDKVAISALVISLIALVTTVVQLTQAIIAGAKGLPNCDARIMGRWAKFTSRRFRWWQLRLEIDFDAPVIFLARQDNNQGPVKGDTPIWYADGSRDSCELFRVDEPLPEGQDNDEDFNPHMIRERVHTVDNELATWVKLLGAVQTMERYSRQWEHNRWRAAKLAQPELASCLTLAVGVQAKKRSFDANPSSVKKPYATTTICHIVEVAAVLGLYWKEFNRDQNKYRAEGNGYSLLGTRMDDFGIVFVFEKCGWPKFKENRIIPTSEVKELCFGNVPTFYRVRDRVADEAWNAPFNEQRSLQTLQLGSRKEIADTLNLIGCNSNTALYCLREKRHIHLFPVTFEILGMLGRTLHVKDRCFTYLPNPTIFQWNRGGFSLRRMLDEFHKHISQDISVFSREGYTLPAELEQVNAMSSFLNHTLPHDRDSDFEPNHLNQLHEQLAKIDDMLAEDKMDKDVVLDVLRRHLQEVLLAINTTADQAAGRAPPNTPVALADISFDDLLSVPPENREREFMKKYFTEIRHRVISTDAREHHDPRAADASRAIHTKQALERQGAAEEEERRLEKKQGLANGASGPHGAAEEKAKVDLKERADDGDKDEDDPRHPSALKTRGTGMDGRVGSMKLPQRATTWGTTLGNAFEVRRNNIWCTLVLRMLLWLLLHDFDKNDVQVSKSELMGSRLPVYIM